MRAPELGETVMLARGDGDRYVWAERTAPNEWMVRVDRGVEILDVAFHPSWESCVAFARLWVHGFPGSKGTGTAQLADDIIDERGARFARDLEGN